MKHIKKANRYILSGQEYAELLKGSDQGYKQRAERFEKHMKRSNEILQRLIKAGIHLNDSCLQPENDIFMIRRNFSIRFGTDMDSVEVIAFPKKRVP